MARHRKAALSGAVAGANGLGEPQRRCAIYTRKSTEEGLSQEFNSLDAQREACEAFIRSQRHEGWRLLPQGFADGGYSGGNMERPGLQALLAAVDQGEIDVVVVYKVDRLTRSLADFARIVDRFDRQGVSFVSVTQAFNTTTSMGRLTLNVLLSFAQFEREVGAERVRDKVAASRRKGMWMGGAVPFGYRAADRKLAVDEEEAEQVRLIFRLYLELGSTTQLLADLRRRGVRTAKRLAGSGRKDGGGGHFGPGAIGYLLRNRIYRGQVEHRGEVYPGEHQAIVDPATFEAAQEMLSRNANCKRQRARSRAILTGLIFDAAGNRMSPSHANKGGARYRYYHSRALSEGRPEEAGSIPRVSAPDIEQRVIEALRAADGAPMRSGADRRHEPAAMEDEAQALSLIERLLERVDVHHDHLAITLREPSRANDPQAGPGQRVISLPWSKPKSRPQATIIEASQAEPPSRSALHGQLIKQIHQARTWLKELSSGRVDGIDAIARREGKHPRSIRTCLSFAFLAPDLIAGILQGETPSHLTLTEIGRGLPLAWSEQRRLFHPQAEPI